MSFHCDTKLFTTCFLIYNRCMEVKRSSLLEGAKEARGLTVIIDVFRAFSLQCYMYDCGAQNIICVKEVEDAFMLKKDNPDYILVGERNGIKVDGFMYGNSPSEFVGKDLRNQTMIHTTSAGVQGLAAAHNSDQIITGSLVNAKAISTYIKRKNPDFVTLVAMGWNGIRKTEEDELCAELIEAYLNDEEILDIEDRINLLKTQEGAKFFDENKPEFPKEDFKLCTALNRFDHVIEVNKEDFGYTTRWVEV